MDISEPYKVFYTYTNSTGHDIKVNVGEGLGEPTEETLFEKTEAQVLRQAISNQSVIGDLMKLLGIQYPTCWIILEEESHNIVPSWDNPKSGDIDIIAGNFKDDGKTPDFSMILGVQLKIRKITKEDKFKNFASGRGTTQSHYTALMGFDKTMLLHFLIKEPQAPKEGYTAPWKAISQGASLAIGRKNEKQIKYEAGKELYGYGWLGWGQAYQTDWNLSGSIKEEIVHQPPDSPWRDRVEMTNNRIELIKYLERTVIQNSVLGHPHIIDKNNKAKNYR